MFIRKLILKGYKRLFLSNIDIIEYTPESNIQIVLGANGSGKSSLIGMLNPLPADTKKDFYEDGYKYIEITHRGKEYILSSGYIHTNKHSFNVDGSEYNNGGTRSVQLELVKEHFGITNNINNILLGTDKLTTMSPALRKHWFSELSTIDFTFAIQVYNKLRQRHRDIVGGIKLLQDETIKINAQVLNKDELLKLKENRQILEEFITYIVSQYNHEVNTDLNETMSKIDKLNRQILNIGTIPTTNNLQELQVSKIRLETNLININTEIENINKYLTILDKARDYINKPLEELKQEEVLLSSKYNTIINSLVAGLDKDNVSAAIISFKESYGDVISHLSDLEEYKEIIIDNVLLQKLLLGKDTIETKLHTATTKLTFSQMEIKRLQDNKVDANKIKCECGREWYHNYNENELSTLQELVIKLNKDITNLTTELTKVTTTYNKYGSKETIINNIKNVIKLSGLAKYIWEHVLQKVNNVWDNPSQLISELNKVITNIDSWESIASIEKELYECRKSIDVQAALFNAEIEVSVNKIKEYEDKLTEATTRKNSINTELNTTISNINMLTKLADTYNELYKMLSNTNSNIKQETIQIRNTILNDLTITLKKELVTMDQQISNHDIINNRLVVNYAKIDEYKNIEKVLSVMIKELSPSEGLIAKSINSFLNVFITEMNNIINSVWSYDMMLLPCEVTDDNDLDYKFKVYVNNDETIEDVSKLSSSMQEMVDLAFKIVFIKYMHLTDTPLILDEFGRTFDENHRNTAYNIINTIIAENFSQIFIISHFESMYGRFKNADFVVLNENNLTLDPNINYNTVMKIN